MTEWKSLTKSEIDDIARVAIDKYDFARAIEAALKEKNMTRDSIIRMAHKAGLFDDDQEPLPEHLERFAALVAAEEREACAKLCEQAGIDGYGTLAIAAMIRAREQT
jgi:hypothetical protein